MSVGSIKSIVNRYRAWSSYVLSLVGIVRVRHMPVFVSIEPSNRCQLHCPQCPVGMGHNSNPSTLNAQLSTLHFQLILDRITPYADTLILYFQGEPLLNKDLPQMIRLAHERGLYTMLSTNGQAMTPLLAEQLVKAGLNRIIVSVDGMSQESYGQYRVGGDLRKALAAIGYLREAKCAYHSPFSILHSPFIEMQCLRLRNNEHEWAMMRRSYRKIGADRLTLKTAQFYDYEHGNDLMPTNPRYCRYVQGKDGLYYPKNRLHSSIHQFTNSPIHQFACWRLWSGCVIDIDGNVRPCCFDKEGKYIFGNVYEQPLQDIWHGDQANAFRKAVLQHRDMIDICNNCTTK